MTGPLLLVLDTATRQPAVGVASGDGNILRSRSWPSAHRHGEQLLSELEALLHEVQASTGQLSGIVVGTGPGSFTGLRIGLATAKVLAYSLAVPLVGIPTTAALALAATGSGEGASVAVTLPAGAADRYVARYEVRGGEVVEAAPIALVPGPDQAAQAIGDALLVAIELPAAEMSPEVAERGRNALSGLTSALARLGAARLNRGEADDIASLVPAYVALPRGIGAAAQEMVWSPDHR